MHYLTVFEIHPQLIRGRPARFTADRSEKSCLRRSKMCSGERFPCSAAVHEA